MMFQQFSHYLSYGSTDQATIANLAGSFTGLVVPGTVATFQHQGTGGFVLTLSAANAGLDYVLDPRFPLFQQALVQPKKGHHTLADVLGDPQLVSSTSPAPSDFPDPRLDVIAQAWVDFNLGYQTSASGKFAKYAKRLKRAIQPHQSQGPSRILAPYFVVSDPADPWWDRSCYLFDATLASAAGRADVARVVASSSAGGLSQLIGQVPEDDILIWVSDLQELHAAAPDLSDYLASIASGSGTGKHPFALYGGFFSVLASSVGLVGSSHGIGFSEHRNWIELPQSGPPPARYYLPRAHRYVSVELAQAMYLADPALIGCTCVDCSSTPPLTMDYQALMRHSVRSRTSEIGTWSGLTRQAAKANLSTDVAAYLGDVQASPLPAIEMPKVIATADHLHQFVAAL